MKISYSISIFTAIIFFICTSISKPFNSNTEALFDKHIKTLRIDAGSFYNTKTKNIEFSFNNPYNYPLEVLKFKRGGNDNSTCFNPGYAFGEIILANENFTFYFSINNSISRKKEGRFRDEWLVNLRYHSNSSLLVKFIIDYELINNQTKIVFSNNHSLELPENDTSNFYIHLTNMRKIPDTIYPPNYKYSYSKVKVAMDNPITLAPQQTDSLLFSYSTVGKYGSFNDYLSFRTNEPIERPKTKVDFSGDIIGSNHPVIEFDTLLKYREIEYNGDGRFEFWFTNTGNRPLIINLVKTSDGGAMASSSNKPIPPRERGVIMVRYNSRRIGPFNRSITVYRNAFAKELYYILKEKCIKQRNKILFIRQTIWFGNFFHL